MISSLILSILFSIDFQVCTKANHTYTSDCEFYQMQCWCGKTDERCTRKEASTDAIDYFGRCQSKRRSRDWYIRSFLFWL